MAQKTVTGSRFRVLAGLPRRLQQAVLISISLSTLLFLLDIPSYLGVVIWREQFLGLFTSLTLAAVFVSIPATSKAPHDRVPWYDLLLSLASLAPGLYIAVLYPKLTFSLGYVTPEKVILASVLLLLVAEACRRFESGWALVAFLALFVIYGLFASSFPGAFMGQSTDWPNLMNYLYLDTSGFLSMMDLTATIGLSFFLFGQALLKMGCGQFLTELATAIAGGFRGGPAKVAVIASSFFGTISGGPVANVVMVGTFTIPLMKKTGYRPVTAAAIEAVASTGGSLMPPVMGAGAFIIAQTLGVPYADVALAAFLPAVLYYGSVFYQVHFEAAKYDIRGLPREERPLLGHVITSYWPLAIPISSIIVFMFVLRLDAPTAAMYSAGLTLVFSLLLKANRSNYGSKLLAVFEDTARIIAEMGMILGLAGFIVSVINVSGMGFNISYALVQIAGGSVLVLLIGAAVASYLLGLGLPAVPAYVIPAALVVPVLTQLGINPMGAHLFVFYYAILSNITPPIAVSCVAAASIAGANQWRVGWASMKLAFIAYLAPFIFVFNPALLLVGTPLQIAGAAATSMAGIGLVGGALVGYLFAPLSPGGRLVAGMAGMGLLLPTGLQAGSVDVGILANLVGLAVLVALVVRARKAAREAPVGLSPTI